MISVKHYYKVIIISCISNILQSKMIQALMIQKLPIQLSETGMGVPIIIAAVKKMVLR